MQDVVDPVIDEMLAKFVVDSHFKSQPKGGNVEDKSLSNSQDDFQPSDRPLDPEVPVCHSMACIGLKISYFKCLESFCSFQILSQDMLKKYLTYAKLNVFPRLHDADLNKLTHVYAELRKESSVRLSPDN